MNMLINKGWLKDIVNQQCDLIEKWFAGINEVREYLINSVVYGNITVDKDSVKVYHSGKTNLVTARHHDGIVEFITITKDNIFIETNGTSVVCSNNGRIVYDNINEHIVHGLKSIVNAFVLANEIK